MSTLEWSVNPSEAALRTHETVWARFSPDFQVKALKNSKLCLLGSVTIRTLTSATDGRTGRSGGGGGEGGRGSRGEGGGEVQGYLAHKKQPPPLGSQEGPRHSPTVGSWEGRVSYERSNPVGVRVGVGGGLGQEVGQGDFAL